MYVFDEAKLSKDFEYNTSIVQKNTLQELVH